MTARQPKGIPVGGQFAPEAHGEPGVALAPARSYDPEAVAKGILKDLRDIPAVWTNELFLETHNAARAGKVSYESFLDDLIAKNHNGRCSKHESERLEYEFFCRDCHVAYMVEARTNPKPQPVPRGVIPVLREQHQLNSETLTSGYDPETKIDRTVTRKTGDEKFEAAVRQLFEAADDAPVEVIQYDTEWGTDWTRQMDSEITVKCGTRTASYNHMGDLMRALDQTAQSPHAMALRFMRADRGERPLLKGIAAVYLHRGEHRDPEPIFGKINNVFSEGWNPSMHFMHTDGREDYIHFDEVVAILETDQSVVYDES